MISTPAENVDTNLSTCLSQNEKFLETARAHLSHSHSMASEPPVTSGIHYEDGTLGQNYSSPLFGEDEGVLESFLRGRESRSEEKVTKFYHLGELLRFKSRIERHNIPRITELEVEIDNIPLSFRVKLSEEFHDLGNSLINTPSSDTSGQAQTDVDQ